MIRRPPRSTRTDTLCPYTTLFRTRSQYGVRALDWMFSRPIFRTSDFVAAADIPRPTANRILRLVRDEGLLRVLHPASGRRAAVLGFSELLNIAAGRSEERRVGKECGSTCRSRWSQDH